MKYEFFFCELILEKIKVSQTDSCENILFKLIASDHDFSGNFENSKTWILTHPVSGRSVN